MSGLYWSRQREQEYAEREAAGENLWTYEVPSEVRNKIFHGLAAACSNPGTHVTEVIRIARQMVLVETGWPSLSGVPDVQDAKTDFQLALDRATGSLFPTLVEALVAAHYSHFRSKPDTDNFEAWVNEVFNRHRIAWELVEGRMVAFESKELHTEVVEPTLRLLSHSGWDQVEAAYQKALRELAEGHADDAITDAAAAVQETLKLLQCDGNSLGPLASSARDKGLLSSYDKKLVDWVEADRSNRGDAHSGESGATREDAWLVVHVAGALVLRLTTGTSRSTS